MCGRFALKYTEQLKETFKILGDMPPMPDRYNIAPTQSAPVIGTNPETHARTMVEMRWGLVPHWAKDLSTGNKMFNARAEGLAERPAFKPLLGRRRCVIPASGFYEWKKEGKERLPFYFSRKDGKPMGLAGLHATWGQGEQKLHTFTIITTAANDALKPIHDRMPVILTDEEIDAWLDLEIPPEIALEALMPLDAGDIQNWRVSKAINKALTDGIGLIKPEPENSL